MFTPLRVRSRRLSAVRRNASRRFRPSLDAHDSAAMLEARFLATTGAGFYAIGLVGNAMATAFSAGINTTDNESTLPAPAGGTASSGIQEVTQRGLVFTPAPTWIDQVTVTETGIANTTVTANTAGSVIGEIELYGSHIHGDEVTVNNIGGWPVNTGALANPTLQERTQLQGGNYTWQTQEDVFGTFNPNRIVTVDFSVNITPETPQFTEAALLNIASTHITVQLGTNVFGPAHPDPGLTIIDNTNGNILYQDTAFTSGNYTGQWTFPAAQVEQLAYNSQFLTGPAGTFNIGTAAATPGFTYSFHVTM